MNKQRLDSFSLLVAFVLLLITPDFFLRSLIKALFQHYCYCKIDLNFSLYNIFYLGRVKHMQFLYCLII